MELTQTVQIFEAFIRKSFADVPGKCEVGDNKFTLMTSNGEQLSWRTWEKYAKPGVTVFMSVVKMSLLGEQGHCPRCWETGNVSTSLRCSGGVTWFACLAAPAVDILILYSSNCQLLYFQQPSICSINFWTHTPTKCKRTTHEIAFAEDLGPEDLESDDLHLDEYSDYSNNHEGWERSHAFDSISADATNGANCKSSPLPIQDLINPDDIAPFKRIYCTKSKDSHHCIERVIDLFLLIRSLILKGNHGDTELLLQRTDSSAECEQILQRLLRLRDKFSKEPIYSDPLNSMTLVMATLSAIHRLKQVLTAIRKSASLKFDVFLVMATFLMKAGAIRNLHECRQSGKITSTGEQSS